LGEKGRQDEADGFNVTASIFKKGEGSLPKKCRKVSSETCSEGKRRVFDAEQTVHGNSSLWSLGSIKTFNVLVRGSKNKKKKGGNLK